MPGFGDRYCNEPRYRREWLASSTFKDYVHKYASNSADERNVASRTCRRAYGWRYFNRSARELDIQVGFLAIWSLVYLAGLLLSKTAISKAFKGDGGAIALILISIIASFTAAYFQLSDGWVPSLRAKFFHSIFSLIGLAIGIAVPAYNYGGSDPKAVDRYDLASAILMAIAALTLFLNGFRLFLEGVASSLGRAPWGRFVRLVFHQVPPLEAAWDSLPAKEQVWALEALLRAVEMDSRANRYPRPSIPPVHFYGNLSDDIV